MEFNIDNEINKMMKMVNNNQIYWYIFTTSYYGKFDARSAENYILHILTMTMQHPEIESYLKELITKFPIDKLNIFKDENSILHYMTDKARYITLNSFEIIINHGVNINIVNSSGDTALNYIFHNTASPHINDVLKLFIRHGANLNIKNKCDETVLDKLVYYGYIVNNIKDCIITIIDAGGVINTSRTNDTELLKFINDYSNLLIKPAIKK